jgi:hypothetical protein
MEIIPCTQENYLAAIARTDVHVWVDGDRIVLRSIDEVTPPYIPLTPREFRNRFTDLELSMFATSTDAGVKLLLLKIATAGVDIDLRDSPSVSAGLDYLVSKNLLIASRKAEILA